MNYSNNDDAWVDEMLIDSDDELFTESDDESDDEGLRESDDERAGESDDEFYGAESEDPEFLSGLIQQGIGSAISGVRNLIGRKPRSSRSVNAFRPGSSFLRHSFSRRTPNIGATSNLSGTLNTNRGPFSFKLPPNIATKDDLKKLAATVMANDKKQETAIKRNANAVRGNVAAIRKTNADLSALDKKHSAVELRQNKILETINKRVVRLRKDAEQTKQQMQMQTMMSLIMQPKLESIRLQAPPTEGGVTPDPVTFTVQESKFKSDMLPLIFMMSSFGGGGSSDGNMMNNPMMLYFLMGK